MSWFLAAAEEAPKPALGFLTEGNVSEFFVMVIVVGLIWYMVSRARAGMAVPAIRKINGLEAVEEAIGRATEMGRPVFYVPGIRPVDDEQTIASYGVLGHLAKQCAKYDTRLIAAHADVLVTAIDEEIIRQSYLEAGRPDAFNPDDVRYLGDQFPFASGAIGIMEKEKPAANIYFGSFYAESLILAENGYKNGAIQIGGTANTHQLPFLMAACDYCLVGEEIYAASAYLSKDPVITGSVVGQDWTRIGVAIIVVLGALLNTFGGDKNFVQELLSK